MKSPLLASILFGVFAISVGCEMHPPSQTVKGYAEKEAHKEAVEQKEAQTPEGGNPQAPGFFKKSE